MKEIQKKLSSTGLAIVLVATLLMSFPLVSAAPPDKCEPWPECKDGGEEPPPPIPATYLGGINGETGNPWGSIAVDAEGNVYITGETTSPDFPTTPGAFDTTPDPADAFIVKMDPTLTTLIYSTFLAGDGYGNSFGQSITVDADGYIYVTGFTADDNFPTTTGAYDTTFNGLWDAFVVKLNPAGNGASDLVYSTFLGGSELDSGQEIRLDASGNVYVGGWTDSSEFPTTSGAYDTTYDGSRAGFIAKLNMAGDGASDLVYSTYLGGSASIRSLAVGASGNAFVTGATNGDFPTTTGAYDTTFNGAHDAFAVKLNPAGGGASDLVYSTFLGGSGYEEGWSVDVDASGNAYVTGLTRSSNFPTTDGAFDTSRNSQDAFVTKLNADGSNLVYSTFLGGKRGDEARGIVVDSDGNAHVSGATESRRFPTTPDAFDKSYNGNWDAFVTELNADGSGLVYSTFVGGTGPDLGHSIATDTAGNMYATGHTLSDDFPVNPDCYDPTYGGSTDVWIAKLP
ncbi:MAG: SBBP repeat-containing protein [Candidatus Thermoplasmatota archaeon]|nr:SBBP repeat-containing protein [Candidatus Thermoplasmatota archaeon]